MEEHVQTNVNIVAVKPAKKETLSSTPKAGIVRCRTNVKRDVIKRGGLNHLTPREKSREYKRLVGRVDKHCSACDVDIDRCGFAKHCTTKKHLLAEEVIKLRAQLNSGSNSTI